MKKAIPLLFLIASFFLPTLKADEAPQLVIDPHGHLGVVWELLFTPDGEELVSVSADKTIRFWDAYTGSLTRTLRGEMGDGPLGKLYAGALSPDGNRLAVGGFLPGENGKNDANVGDIRIINLESGAMTGRLHGNGDVIRALAISKDGRYLASGSADRTVVIWDLNKIPQDAETATILSEGAVLKDHGASIQCLDFSPDGDTLLSTDTDGSLILWKRSGGIWKNSGSLKRDSKLFEAKFTPDGKYIVTGGENELLLWDASSRSLERVIDPDMGAWVGTVTISPDGSRVMAAAYTVDGGKKCTVYTIPEGNLTATFTPHNNTILSSAWHPTRDLIASYGGDNNDIYLWEPKGEESPPTQHIVSAGKAVWALGLEKEQPTRAIFTQTNLFLPENQGKDPENHFFDFENFILSDSPADEETYNAFQGAIMEMEGNAIQGAAPHRIEIGSLGSIEINAFNNDSIRAVSFSADGSQVIVGSSYALASYGKTSSGFEKQNDFIGHEGILGAIAPSADGAYLGSGSMDQTVRLWNLETGDLLASLFTSTDGEWVCWTPDGYFAASEDGGKFIGWHFNRGIDRMADYLSGDQLYDRYYRPDVVAQAVKQKRRSADIVNELGLEFDLQKAAEGMPEIEILDPDGDMKATERRIPFKVAAIDKGNGVGDVRVFHEGKRLQPDGPGTYRGGKLEMPFTVSLLSGTNEVKAVAVDPEGVESPAKTIQVQFEGTKASSRMFVLAVGINEYKNPRFNLNYCRPDVDALTASLENRSNKLFTEISLIQLYDDDATREAIEAKLKEIAAEATPEDVFIFAFAGHGVMSEGTGGKEPEFHIVPYDVTQMYGDDDQLSEKAIPGSTLRNLASAIPARKQLMVLDACQSGGMIESFAVRGAAEERALAQLARSTGMYVLASTRSEQFATEAKELGHGLFTYAFLEGLDGKGDGNGDGKITVKEVEAWLNERVPELSEKHTGGAQYPNSFARGQDFPLGLIE